MAISTLIETTPRFSFRAFRAHGKIHRDGWGLAYFSEGCVRVVKEPIPAPESDLSVYLSHFCAKSNSFLAHVRMSSRGSVCHANTHPFYRMVKSQNFRNRYSEWVFCHNGTLVKSVKELPVGRFVPIGQTDSEHAFGHLCFELETNGRRISGPKDFKWIFGILRKINQHGTFNTIFSNSEFIFCYRDLSGGGSGLTLLKRHYPYGNVLFDDDFEIDLGAVKEKEQRTVIVASRKLSDEPYETVQPGSMLVLRCGEIVWTSSKQSPSNSTDNTANLLS